MEIFNNQQDTFTWITQNSNKDCRILCIDSIELIYCCDIKPVTHQEIYQKAVNKKYFPKLIELQNCSQLFIISDWEYKRLSKLIPLHFNTYESHHLVFACKGKNTKALYELMKNFH